MELEQMEKLMDELRKVHQWSKELSERKKEIMELFKIELDSQGVDKITINGATVGVVNRKGSIKWDAAKLARVLTPEQLEEVHTIGEGSTYLRFTEEKVDSED